MRSTPTIARDSNTNLSIGFGSTTTITQSAGSLEIGAGASVTVRHFNVAGGVATLDGTLQNLSGRPTLNVSGGALTGFGQIVRGDLSLEGGTFSPGNSPGTFSVSEGNATFAGGGRFAFEIDNATGLAGVNWDLLSIARFDLENPNGIGGGLNITATGADRFTLLVISQIGGNVAGPLANFDPTQDYSFIFATTTHGIAGFDAFAFDIDLGGFANAYLGLWSVAQLGNDLSLVYTYDPNIPDSAVPEPSTYASIAGVAALGLALWRKRRTVR